MKLYRKLIALSICFIVFFSSQATIYSMTSFNDSGNSIKVIDYTIINTMGDPNPGTN